MGHVHTHTRMALMHTRTHTQMVAVGYSTEGATPYWVIRNSWGSGWAESGYV